MLLAIGQDLFFDITPEQVVGRLQRVDLSRLLEFPHLVDVKVRDAYEADLAFRYESHHGLGRFLERRARIGPVELVEIDVVDSQVSQALFDALAHPSRACVAHPFASSQPHPPFGARVPLVSPASQLWLQPLAQDPFRHTETVGWGPI